MSQSGFSAKRLREGKCPRVFPAGKVPLSFLNDSALAVAFLHYLTRDDLEGTFS